MLFSQMQKDISAMVVPLYGFVPDPKDDGPKDKKEQQEKAQQEYFKRFGLQIEVESEKVKSISFVTTNLLSVYGSHKPRLARVRYLMVPDTTHVNYFTLMRQESPEIEIKDFERDIAEHKNYSHAIAFGIKSSSIACISITMHDKEKKVEEVSSWSFAELLKKQKPAAGKDKVEQPIALPQIITLSGIMGDMNSDHEHPFSYSFFIPIDSKLNPQQPETKEPEKPETPKETKAPAGKPATPAVPAVTKPGGLLSQIGVSNGK
jgi:hypothetical protein